MVTVAVVAAKVALVWLALTVTLAGTVSDALLLLKLSVLAKAPAWFKVTVQVLDALLPSAEGEQDKEVSCDGAFAVRVNDWDAPFKDALSNAV